jgi:hypothetical protein
MLFIYIGKDFTVKELKRCKQYRKMQTNNP